MIPGRRGDNPFLLLLVGELNERVTRPTLLETSGALEVIELAINLHPRELAQRD